MDTTLVKSEIISIIIPCYNDAKFIEQAVDSALVQTYKKKEIIVVDDGSNIETKKVLKKLEPKINLLITQENKGPSAARNSGIINAKGTYIAVLDSDDSYNPEFCAKAVEILETKNDIKLVTCYTQRFTDKGPVDIIKPHSSTIIDFLKYNCAMGSSIFRKKDWEECKGYDEHMKIGFEDWEFYIRLLANGGTSYVIPEILLNYRMNKQSRTTQANKIKYELFRNIINKHKELYLLYFDDFVDHLLNRLEIVESSERKNLNKFEYRIGENILMPFRKIKRIFKV